jgi:hypothetical protein
VDFSWFYKIFKTPVKNQDNFKCLYPTVGQPKLEIGARVQIINDTNKTKPVHKIVNINKGWYELSNNTKKFRAKELMLKTTGPRLYDIISIPYMSDKIRSFLYTDIDLSKFMDRIITNYTFNAVDDVITTNVRKKIAQIKRTYTKVQTANNIINNKNAFASLLFILKK